MGRIPQEEVERLKREVSLVDLVRSSGVELKGSGENLLGLCPFHEDHSPSLVVSPTKNLWNCLGACRASGGISGGSVIDWVMRREGVSFRHAAEILRKNAGGKPREEVSLPPEAEGQRLLETVVAYYQRTLKESPEALRYLQKRGLTHPEMMGRFRLGFANRTLGYRLPGKHTKAGAKLKGELVRLGVLRQSGHEHLTGSLVIPIFGEHGEILQLYGRKINDNLRDGTAYHLYLRGSLKGVWNIEALAASKEIILCEALLDALAFWCAGFRNVTSCYGASGFTESHREALRRYGTRRVLIAFDADEAGDEAAEKLASELLAIGTECFRIEFPRGMDANQYALEQKPAAHSLGALIRGARWMGKAQAPRREFEEEPVIETSPAPENTETSPERELAPSLAALPTPAGPKPPETSGLLAVDEKPVLSPVPVAPGESAPPVERQGEDLFIRCGERRYRVRGLSKNLSYEHLRLNVLVTRRVEEDGSPGTGLYVDTLDLYSARARGHYARDAAHELRVKESVIRKDLGRILLALERLQEEIIRKSLEPRDEGARITKEEEEAALLLLKDPELLSRILTDFEKCGVVGEETNKLVGYLAAVSRKLDTPLAVIIQSSSAAGKTSLMEAVLSFLPPEDFQKYSAMTGQSLFYMGEEDLKHKLLAIIEEEGAEEASYALKLLQSEGELHIASTGKDPSTGRLTTQDYRVKGPVSIMLTTTAVEIGEELQNRCVVLTVNEGREQTRAIHQRQRESQTLEGLLSRQEREEVLKTHRNAQRLLRPLLVANPFAKSLTFLDDRTRTRRDHMKYLTLIRAIALLHQHQREIKTISREGRSFEYIEVTREDILVANRLSHEVLGRSLDELSPQTRNLLLLLDEMVSKACAESEVERRSFRFSRLDVRRFTGWSDYQVRVHMGKLLQMEYVVAHRGGRGLTFVYELLYDGGGKDGRPYLTGLLDPEVPANNEHEKADIEGGASAQGASTEAPPGDGTFGENPNDPGSLGTSSETLAVETVREETERGS